MRKRARQAQKAADLEKYCFDRGFGHAMLNVQMFQRGYRYAYDDGTGWELFPSFF